MMWKQETDDEYLPSDADYELWWAVEYLTVVSSLDPRVAETDSYLTKIDPEFDELCSRFFLREKGSFLWRKISPKKCLRMCFRNLKNQILFIRFYVYRFFFFVGKMKFL